MIQLKKILGALGFFAALQGALMAQQGTFVIINELDCDSPSSDTLEFIELYDGGIGNTPLDDHVVVLFNGSSDTSYQAFDLDGFSTNANGYFVLGNAAVANVDLVFPDNTLQNGADAAALYLGEDTDFPSGTPVTTTNLLDAIVYDTNDSDDAGLLVLLNANEPQVNEDGAGDKDNHSNQRCPNGGGGLRNTSAYIQTTPTPGEANDCDPQPPTILINEVDADNPLTDTLEFIELYDGGVGNTALDGAVVVLYNGSIDEVYAAFDLDGFSTNADGYFVIGNVGIPQSDFIIPDNTIQNGQDAVAVYAGNDTDFPNGSGIVTTDLIDAFVYGTNDSDDAELAVLLNPGQPQINEGGFGDKDNHSSQRCLNGDGGALNTDRYIQNFPTLGAPNDCITPPSTLTINEALADPPSDISGDANGDGVRNGSEDEFVELVNLSGAELDISGWELRDSVATRHLFPAGTVLNDGCGIVVFGGGAPSGNFGCNLVQVASTGFIGLNNSGDNVEIVDESGLIRALLVFGAEGGMDESLTRDPDLAGPFVGHTTATLSSGSAFSPGTQVDGTFFPGCGPSTDLRLLMNPTTLVDGDSLDILINCGLPNGPVGLFIVTVNGVPFVSAQFVSNFDATGAFALSAVIPPGFAGFTIDFQAFGFAAAGNVDGSNIVTLIFN